MRVRITPQAAVAAAAARARARTHARTCMRALAFQLPQLSITNQVRCYLQMARQEARGLSREVPEFMYGCLAMRKLQVGEPELLEYMHTQFTLMKSGSNACPPGTRAGVRLLSLFYHKVL